MPLIDAQSNGTHGSQALLVFPQHLAVSLQRLPLSACQALFALFADFGEDSVTFFFQLFILRGLGFRIVNGQAAF